MCGICGIVDYGSDRVIDRESIERMTRTLRHRGPDDEGYYIANEVGLGMRRLSIIDLDSGHQPIFNEDGRFCIVFNGEIYNYRDLTPLLEGRGHVFKTRSDTEVIVHLYEDHGPECVKYLNGMFAFAIWDSKAKTLFLARDRLGQKPLFYSQKGPLFTFGSEIKSILASGEVERTVDQEALHHFLSLNYMPWDMTMLKSIRKLPPAHTLMLGDGQIDMACYWDIPDDHSQPLREAEYAEGIMSLLKESVKRRLISDVPLGMFLSGGIDSSAIVGLAAQLSALPIKTFSIGFEDKSFSELAHARRIAKLFGTEHHEFMVRSDVKDILPKLVWFSDEPSADSSMIPTYYLSKMTREHVKVALSGDGGDETFGGYLTYPAYKTAALYKKLPRWLRKGLLEKVARRLPVSHKKVSFEYKIKRFLEGAELEPLRAHYWWNGAFGEAEKNELYNPWLREELKETDTILIFQRLFDAKPDMDVLSRLLYVDSKLYLADDILTKVDRASMANSLEVRSPILDYRLVEFAAKIPSHLKIKGGVKKHIFKKATRNLLPYCTRHRSKKGFSIPLSTWLKNELRDVLIDYLSPRRLKATGYFNPVSVERLIKDHLDEKKNNAYYLWGLLIFQIWHEMFIENNPPLS